MMRGIAARLDGEILRCRRVCQTKTAAGVYSTTMSQSIERTQ